jgi:hypothetical protein
MIYWISFSHSYRIEKSAVQLYISPSLFITENENMKHICEWSYETRNTSRTEVSISIARAVYYWGRLNIGCELSLSRVKALPVAVNNFLSMPGKLDCVIRGTLRIKVTETCFSPVDHLQVLITHRKHEYSYGRTGHLILLNPAQLLYYSENSGGICGLWVL